MEEFPIWLKLLIWLVLGGTVVYAAGAAILSALDGQAISDTAAQVDPDMWQIILYGAVFFGLLISVFTAAIVYVLLTDYDDDEEGPEYEEGWKQGNRRN